MKKIIGQTFYLNEDVLALSKALLGKVLVTKLDNTLTSGIIVETEAYNGVSDRASHAYNNRRTARTETMYAKGGVAYIYLCYGMHHLFNIVTGAKDNPQAILIRAIEPLDGIPIMLKRRQQKKLSYRLTAGPGVLCEALGISRKLDGVSLRKASPIWVEDRGILISESEIIASPRIGIDYAKEHKDLPWRFSVRNNPWTSKSKNKVK
ncbi:MAG: DNA-3-methyladenine glycosylase [Proteobacteria bacterium]|nr:DNA-3-methyladenine glycosylase [Pseudomonadota bacterium]